MRNYINIRKHNGAFFQKQIVANAPNLTDAPSGFRKGRKSVSQPEGVAVRFCWTIVRLLATNGAGAGLIGRVGQNRRTDSPALRAKDFGR